jgi:dienelactone hydrolase
MAKPSRCSENEAVWSEGEIPMSQETARADIAKKTAVYRIPGVDSVTIRRDVEYRTTDAGILTMDLYYPPDWNTGARIPAVVVVAGYPDVGFERMLGCKFKDMGSSVSWAQLMAASGLVAITYTNREPAADCYALLEHLRANAAALGIAGDRMAVWASSGNVPLALSVLMRESPKYLKCAVLYYGLMLDLDGSTNVAEAAKQFRFANPCVGKSVDDLPEDLPMFIVRAGQDNPGLNEALDRFVAKSLNRNLPITFVNYPAAPHAFDLLLDSERSREIIRQTLTFLRFHLSA